MTARILILNGHPDPVRKGLCHALADAYAAGANSRHPGFHKTRTVDLAIVLEGEIYAMMDVGETKMEAGDILIQRGTNHAWSNRSGKVCRMAFVLIDSKN